MKKHNTVFLFLFVMFILMIGCKDGDGIKNDNPVPAAPGKQCAGHNKHNHTDTRTYVVDKTLNQKDCFEASTCAATKQDMIARATQAAKTYCSEFDCADGSGNDCNGVFTLISSSCSMASVKLPDGKTECRETVTISGEIDCTCK
jgi:hypothetical protein